MLTALETYLFRYRSFVLGGLLLLTLLATFFAAQIKFTANPERLVPEHHPWIEVSETYLDIQPELRQVFLRVTAGEGGAAPSQVLAVMDAARASTGLASGRVQTQQVEGTGPVIALTLSRDRSPDGVILRQLQVDLAQVEADLNVDIEMAGVPVHTERAASAAGLAAVFFAAGLLVTSVAVFFFSLSLRLTLLAVVASLVSVIWQLGIMQAFGLTLDPVLLLIPFIVYAIGLSHGMQQINVIAQDVCRGMDAEGAARDAFRRLAPPGLLAFVTDLAGFVTLLIVPVGLVRDMAALAAIGIALKIIANLVMLPLIASWLTFSEGYVERMNRALVSRMTFLQQIGGLFQGANSWFVIGVAITLFASALVIASLRVTGGVHVEARGVFAAAAPEWEEALYVDRFTVFALASPNSCGDAETMARLEHAGDVLSPAGGAVYLGAADVPPGFVEAQSLTDNACSVFPVMAFGNRANAQQVNDLAENAQALAGEEPGRIVLAGGTMGRAAASADAVKRIELTSFLAIFGIIIVIVAIGYRDIRAVICCVVPLGLATAIGYAALVMMGQPLTLASLPILVLAVGIGVDYAFYFYNRLRVHLGRNFVMADAFAQAMEEAGSAVIVTGATIALGTLVWLLSPLSLQAEMGALLTVVFLANMIAAVTLLPALAVVMDQVFPRKLRPGEVRP